ncbi:MAG: hypothetical protein H0X62_03595 [Bacteroidetes bacterium]|nr:hypothetical protein [Bacteroidota bacterium]
MPGTLQSIFQNSKPAKSDSKAVARDIESGTSIFNTVSKSHYSKRRKLQKKKQLDEAIKGFFIAVLFLIFGTLMIMYLN